MNLNEIKKGKSLKSAFLFYFSILLGIITALSLYLLVTSALSFIEKRKSLNSIKLVRLLMLGTVELSLERSVTQVSLNFKETIPENFRALLAKQRNSGTPKIKEILSSTDDSEVKKELGDALGRLERIRLEADKNLSVPLADRDKFFVERFPFHFPEILEDTIAIESIFFRNEGSRDNTVLKLEAIQKLAWEMREFGGRERTYFAIALLNQKEFGNEILGRIEVQDSRVRFAKRQLDSLLKDPSIPKSIGTEYQRMNSNYFKEYAEVKDRLKAEISRGVFTQSFDTYFKSSSEALESIEALLRASSNELIPAQESQIQSALMGVIVNLFIGFAGLAIGIYSIRYSTVTIISHITQVTNVLSELAKGNKSLQFDTAHELNIEIATLLEAAGIFRDNMLKLEDLISEQSAAVNQTTTTMRLLENSSKNTADEAQHGSTNSQKAVQVAYEGESMGERMQEIQTQVQESVDDVTKKIELLGEQTSHISSIVSLVAELANQTNMLALNAAVEAARAGEFGKGFSVVASEIRKLADESKHSTVKIQGIVEEVRASAQEAIKMSRKGQDFVERGSKIVTETTAKFKEVSQAAKSVSDVIETIAFNLKEQARAYGEITTAMNSLNQKTAKFVKHK
jgi:methyl-accepting chemotaxis protein